jgi:hypothetical protein
VNIRDFFCISIESLLQAFIMDSPTSLPAMPARHSEIHSGNCFSPPPPPLPLSPSISAYVVDPEEPMRFSWKFQHEIARWDTKLPFLWRLWEVLMKSSRETFTGSPSGNFRDFPGKALDWSFVMFSLLSQLTTEWLFDAGFLTPELSWDPMLLTLLTCQLFMEINNEQEYRIIVRMYGNKNRIWLRQGPNDISKVNNREEM